MTDTTALEREAGTAAGTRGEALPSPVTGGHRRRLVAVALVVAAAVAGGATAALLGRDGPPASDAGPGTAATDRGGEPLAVDLPDGWAPGTPTGADRTAGLVAKAPRRDPAASFLVRSVDTGVGAGSGADVRLDALATSTSRALAAAVAGYDEVSSGVVRVAGRDVVRLVYDQGTGRATARPVLGVLPLDDRTVYVTVRTATAADTERLGTQSAQLLEAAVEAAAR